MQLRSVVGMFVLMLLLMPLPMQAASPVASLAASPAAGPAQSLAFSPTCDLPESNAEALVILSNYYPGYWWDHTDLTVAVQAHPVDDGRPDGSDPGAIATWSQVLDECFDGQITLTDVTGTGRIHSRRRISSSITCRAGGVVFGGYALCGDHGCPNILVRSDLPPSLDRDPYSPEYLGSVTLHELGHALGLGARHELGSRAPT